MNMPFHRKQVIILILALLLAAASYLIPLPQQALPPNPVALPGETPTMGDTVLFARESAIRWRLPVILSEPQSPAVSTSTLATALNPSTPTARQYLNPQDIGNGERLHLNNTPLLWPVGDLRQ